MGVVKVSACYIIQFEILLVNLNSFCRHFIHFKTN
jgi:hypothetical protein